MCILQAHTHTVWTKYCHGAIAENSLSYQKLHESVSLEVVEFTDPLDHLR